MATPTKKEATVAIPQTPAAKRIGALGVLSELETIEPILRRHQQESEAALAQSLDPKVRELLPTLGIDNTSDQIVVEIVRETARQSLADAQRIQTPADATVVVADSLRETLQTLPGIGNRIDLDEEKLTEKIIPQIQDVVTLNQQRLEQAAVLTTAAKIAAISPNKPQDQDSIATSVENTVREHAALLEPRSKEILKAQVANSYLTTYQKAFFKNFKISPTSIPTLSQLQENKEQAHKSAEKEVGDKFSRTALGKPITTRIPPTIVTANIAQDFNLTQPKPPTSQPKIPTLLKFAIIPKHAEEFQLSAFAYDQQTLAKALVATSAKIDSLKKKSPLSYREKKELVQAQKNYARYTKAQSFKIKKPKKYLRNINILSSLYNNRPEVASQEFWKAQYYIQNYMPRIFTSNERLAAGAAWGKLRFPGPDFGSIFSSLKGEISAVPITGMSITTNPVMGLLKKIRNVSALAFGGLLMYFMGLGQAALAGFIAGAAIGVGAGLAFGIGVSLALGPVGLIAAPVIIPLSMLTGGIIGGTAGGLIGLGIGTGSTTAVTTGIGAGVGGASGAVIGGLIGSPLGPIGVVVGATAGAYIGAFLGGLVGYAIGQTIGAIGLPASAAVAGASIGFLVAGPIGALIGAGIGYLISGGASQLRSFLSAGTTAGEGIIGTLGNLATGFASTVWGGITSAGGAALGFFTGAANFIVGGLTSISLPSIGTTVLLTAGPVGLVGGVSTIALTITAVSFATIASDTQPFGIGKNELFTISKTANPTKIENENLPAEITFTITLTAKKPLSNISVSDELTLQSADKITDLDGNSKLASCPNPPPIELPENQSWTCQFSIQATQTPIDYSDSTIRNNVTVTDSSTEGTTTDSATAFVIIGTPPSDCPVGWPTAHGRITQGPRGSTSHARLAELFGEEAIDIGDNFNNEETFATFNGSVFYARSTVTDGWGLYVDLEGICAGQPFRARYAHLSSIDAQMIVGQPVVFGQKIGRIGKTGTTDDHLHYALFNLGMVEPYIPQTPTPSNCEDGATPCNIRW